MGIILFYLHYLIALVLLDTITMRIYVKGNVDNSNYNTKYYKTDNDVRRKLPLWLLLLLAFVFIIPVINLIVYSVYLGFTVYSNSEDNYNKYYVKSFLTKEY